MINFGKKLFGKKSKKRKLLASPTVNNPKLKQRSKSSLFSKPKINQNQKTFIVGNDQTRSRIQMWISQKQYEQNILLISGPSGCGKTLSALTYLKNAGFHVVVFDAGENLSKNKASEKLKEAFQYSQMKKLALVVDNVDGTYKSLRLDSDFKQGLVKALYTFIRSRKMKLHIPIICICNEYVHRDVQKLKKYRGTTHLFFNSLSNRDMVRLLHRWKVCLHNQKEVNDLTELAHGDVRQLKFNVDMYKLNPSIVHLGSTDNQSVNYFKTMKCILSGQSSRSTESSILNDISLYTLGIHENHLQTIPKKNLQKMVFQTSLLSLCDVLHGNYDNMGMTFSVHDSNLYQIPLLTQCVTPLTQTKIKFPLSYFDMLKKHYVQKNNSSLKRVNCYDLMTD